MRVTNPTGVTKKAVTHIGAPKAASRAYVPSREEVERYERKIAERSPRMSSGARQFLAQKRANPDYRRVMRDLADK